MKLYVADFYGKYLGGYALVWANSSDEALDVFMAQTKETLDFEVKRSGVEITELDIPKKPFANILWDGDY